MTLNPIARTIPAIITVLVLAACSTNPVTGKQEFLLMSAEQERALGAQAAQQVEQQIGLVRDVELNAYVSAIGQRLAKVSPRQDVEYRFHVANMPEPNAFALPGGYIYVSRGLLALTNSEAELANVIGHEIGHVAARHSAQRQTRATGVGLLTVLGTVLAGSAGGSQAAQVANQIGQVAGAGLIASYSRDQERQSDEIGQKMAASTGWDPIGMATFMEQLGGYTVLVTGAPQRPGYLDSHPPSSERSQTAAQRARELEIADMAPIAGDKVAFYGRIDGLLVGDDPAGGVFRDNLLLHPDLGFALAFPAGWDTQNQAAAVIAANKERDAMVQMQIQGPTGDPQAAANEFAQKNSLTLARGTAGQINGFQAYQALAQADTEQGKLGLYLCWIAHPEGMFLVMGMSPIDRFSQHTDAFRSTVNSFRTITDSERGGITERRLDIVAAKRGESLAALSQRTDNRWSIEETRLANDFDAGVTLAAGQRVKIAVERRYSPQ